MLKLVKDVFYFNVAVDVDVDVSLFAPRRGAV
jgi:hypothetical protein